MTPDLDALAVQLPDGAVVVDPGPMDAYRWDRANDPNAGTPLAVVRATSTEDVQTAVRFAARHRHPGRPPRRRVRVCRAEAPRWTGAS